MKSRGQTSLILILILALAFMFYAITLNWAKVASLKTTTWMTAVSSASMGSSLFASYAEKMLQEYLVPKGPSINGNGNPEYCEGSIWELIIRIVTIVILIIIAIFTYGATSYLVILAAALLVASFILEYAVIRPMMLSMWNKLQQNLSPADNQFREQAVMTGLQQLATDPVNIPDRFDMDANGKWGFDANSIAKDKISRFGFFYTERLKLIKPPDEGAYDAFRQALNNLIKDDTHPVNPVTTPPGLGFLAYCGTYTGSPMCNSSCKSLQDRLDSLPHNYWNQTVPTVPYVPTQCYIGIPVQPAIYPHFLGNIYPLLYDPAWENNPANNDPSNVNNSFRFRLGHDDEVAKSKNTDSNNTDGYLKDINGILDPARVTGVVFNMMNDMYKIDTDPAITPPQAQAQVFLNGLGLSVNAQSSVDYGKELDGTTPLANYKATNVSCAQSRRLHDSITGFYWKKGSDRYCSSFEASPQYTRDFLSITSITSIQQGVAPFHNPPFSPSGAGAYPNFHYPYNQCAYMYDGAGNPQNCDEATTGIAWPQDRLDDMVYQIAGMIRVSEGLMKQPIENLKASVEQWYPNIQQYIAPKCSPYITNTADVNYDPVDNFLITSLDLGYLYTKYATDPAVCIPVSATDPGRQGFMIQWLYDLRKWRVLLGDPNNQTLPGPGWLHQTFGGPAGGSSTVICTGALPDVISCLRNKGSDPAYNSYYTKLRSCDVNFPAFIPAGPPLPADCIESIYNAQNATNRSHYFLTDLSSAFQAAPAPPYNPLPAYPNYAAGTPAIIYTAIKNWVHDNRILMEATGARAILLNNLNEEAKNTARLFIEGDTNFTSFMAERGPIDNLLGAVSQHDKPRRLPSFAIYGWKDQKLRVVGNTGYDGLWHIARIEVKQPKALPKLHGYCADDFLGMCYRFCYEEENSHGDVYVRATRWDQNIDGGLAKFANGLSIWQFRSNNPSPRAPQQNRSANEIPTYCLKNIANGQTVGLGLTDDTIASLSANLGASGDPNLGTVDPSEVKALKESFMINIDPDPNRCPADAKPIGNCGATFSDTCSAVPSDYTCCGIQGGYYGGFWTNYCQNTNAARCLQHKQNVRCVAMGLEVAACYQLSTELLRTGVHSFAGSHFGANNVSSGLHEDLFFHSESRTKQDQYDPADASKFGEGTFNE